MMNLTPRVMLGDLDLTDYPFAMEFGADLGVSQNIVRIIESGLDDGELQRVTGNANRTLEIPVLVEGADLMALALAEQMLAVECNKDLNELTLDPGDGFAPVTVFVTSRAQWGYKRDDDKEQNGYRTYQLSIPAQPFGYSEDEVTEVATDLVVTPVSAIISDGTSTTGWTSLYGGLTSVGGELRADSFTDSVPSDLNLYADYRTHWASITYTFGAPVNFAATRYLYADMRMAGGYTLDPYAYVDGNPLRLISKVLLASGMYRVTWACDDPAATTLNFAPGTTSSVPKGSTAPQVRLYVDNVQRSNQAPATNSTGRQSLRLVDVTGSARTAGSVAIEHETAGLGDVLLYTSPTLTTTYNPDLTQYLTALYSTATVAPTSVSGYYFTANKTFEINAATMPSGPHAIMFRALGNGVSGATGDTDVTVTVRSLVGGNVVASEVLPAVAIPADGDLPGVIYTAGILTLPMTNIPAESTDTTLEYEVNGDIRLDGLWSFYVGEDSDLTWVKAGAGTPAIGTVHNRLFLDSPSIANGGAPALFLGTSADRSNAFHPGYPAVQSWGRHLFAPPTVAMMVVTTSATYPQVTLRHRPAWHTHAGQ